REPAGPGRSVLRNPDGEIADGGLTSVEIQHRRGSRRTRESGLAPPLADDLERRALHVVGEARAGLSHVGRVTEEDAVRIRPLGRELERFVEARDGGPGAIVVRGDAVVGGTRDGGTGRNDDRRRKTQDGGSHLNSSWLARCTPQRSRARASGTRGADRRPG